MAKVEIISFKPDFMEVSIIAIHTTLTAHLLAFHFDRTFFSQFWLLSEEFDLSHQKQIRQHTCFIHKQLEKEEEIWLVQNSGSGGLLFSKKPIPDFFLVFKGESHKFIAEEWLENTKSMRQLITTWMIDEDLIPKFEWTGWLFEIKNNPNEEN